MNDCICKGQGYIPSHIMKDDKIFAGILPCPTHSCLHRQKYYDEIKSRMAKQPDMSTIEPPTPTQSEVRPMLHSPSKQLQSASEFPHIDPHLAGEFSRKLALGEPVVLTFNTPFGKLITQDLREANWKIGIITTYCSHAEQFNQICDIPNVTIFPLDRRLGFKKKK